MVERYAREEMKNIWTIQAKYDSWLKVELAAVRAWERLGFVSKEDADKICANAKFDIARIDEIEKVTKHDVIAFLTSVSESLGEESRFVHYGMTSSDCIDTAVALQMKQSLELIIRDVEGLLAALKERALEHKMTLCVGRSHGIHGEPITFGLVVANWFSEISRAKELLEHALGVISVGKLSGAMGNLAHAPLEFEELVCEFLGLKRLMSATKSSNATATRNFLAHLPYSLAAARKSPSPSDTFSEQRFMKRRNFSQLGKREVARCRTNEIPF